MQKLLTIVDQVRTHYLNGYLESLSIFKARYSPAAPEVLFEIPGETSYPFRLYRVDMASNSALGLKVQELNLSTHLSFEPVYADGPKNARISLHPIVWNNVDFRVGPELDRASLEGWILHWLDVNDEHADDPNGLQGVIHSALEPTPQGEFFEFGVDFGSAPIQAFEALITILASTGARWIEIKTPGLSSG